MSTESLLTAALDYIERGWSVFPLQGKVARVRWQEYQDVRPTREQAEAWWAQWPDAGIGVALGPVSMLTRLDADGAGGVAKALELFGELPATPQFRTPGGGVGWLFLHEDGAESCTLWKGPNDHEELRFQSHGRYTAVPPSPHPDGGFYTWVEAPWDVAVAPLPARVKDSLRSARAAKILRELESEVRSEVDIPDRAVVMDALEHLPPNFVEEYDTWLQVGMALHSVGDDMLHVWDAWSRGCPAKYAEGVCEKRWSSFVAVPGGITGRSIIYWAKQNGWNPPKRKPFTDTGNAARVVERHSDGMRYCHQWGKWLIWDGSRWGDDVAGSAVKKAKLVFEELFEEAMDEFGKASSAARKSDAKGALLRKSMSSKLLQHAIKSQDRRAIDAALYLAQCELPVQPDQLDTDPWLLNCPNGTLDLRTLVLREPRRDDNITKLCPTKYDADATAPRWEQFLTEVFEGKMELVEWLQRLLGYCLTGVTTEHILPIFWGGGANGKSTLITTVFGVMGQDYAGKAPRELLISNKNTTHPTVLTTLHGKRLVAAVETGDMSAMDEVVVKELTGDDAIVCRRMYEDFWTFRPTHKILLATNHRPEVRGTDHAIWRRIKLVPFTVTFPDEKQDKDLLDKLQREASGILAWMVKGCVAWQRVGLGEADAVKRATALYRTEQDRLAEFIAQHFTMDPEGKLPVSVVVAKYSVWARINREPEMNGRAFAQAMRERGIMRDEGKKHFMGIKEV